MAGLLSKLLNRFKQIGVICSMSLVCSLQAQQCELPVLIGFTDIKTDGAGLLWSNTDLNIESWELEFGRRGFMRSFEADIEGIDSPGYFLSNLDPGISYEVYIRAVCINDIRSAWNGPYFFTTAIDNTLSCGLDLPVSDNNCPDFDLFPIEVSGFPGDKLGKEVEFRYVDLIMEHNWPQDLSINLISPSGKTASLFKYRGRAQNNLGNPFTGGCTDILRFDPFSCSTLDEEIQEFSGSFVPEQNFQEIFDGELVNGTWGLQICDKAKADIGTLRYVKLQFAPVSCPRPKDFHIYDTEADHLELRWIASNNCEQLRIEYRLKDAPVTESFIDFVECSRESFILNELDADSEYILIARALCPGDLESQELCQFEFRTACRNSWNSENFDALQVCPPGCLSQCNTGTSWRDKSSSAYAGWKISSGSTPTTLTGPDGDVNRNGNYIYTESSLNCNRSDTLGILVSPCLSLEPGGSCHLSFAYHIFGDADSRLLLQLNNNSGGWITIWEQSGQDKSAWVDERISLSPALSDFMLRFVSLRSGDSKRADIALDQIKLISSSTIDLSRYYLDNDDDGYGQTENSLMICSSSAPPGYSDQGGDCDDDNPTINPSAQELPCNEIDENCNGITDDTPAGIIQYELVNVELPSCMGNNDGSIELNIDGAQPPFVVKWDGGFTGERRENLESGTYGFTITDNMGCRGIIDSVTLTAEQKISYSILRSEPSSCLGAKDGSLEIDVSASSPPFDIRWSNGLMGPSITNLEAGDYTATITDSNGCVLVTDLLELGAQQIINAGVILKRDISCFGEATGVIQVAAFGGQGPYHYQWSNGRTGTLLNGVPAGDYTVSITDANDCRIVLPVVTLSQAQELVIEIDQVEHVDCFGSQSGSISTTVRGGIPPYTYLWSDGSLSEDISDIPAGYYSLSVRDANGCTSRYDSIQIIENDRIVIELDELENIRCQGSSKGSITVKLSGGLEPYFYSWSGGQTPSGSANSIENLSSGRYFLTVADRLGCKSAVKSYEIINLNEELNISTLVKDSVRCHNESGGSIIAVSSNARPPIDFNWSAGRKVVKNMLSDTLSSLFPGKYNLTITDSEGCVGISDSINISNPEEISFQLFELFDNRCFEGEEGYLEILVSGGTMPVEVLWSDGQSGAAADNLANGLYDALITDARACQLTTPEYVISSPPALTINLDIRDAGLTENGRVVAHADGGVPPYRFEWLPDTNGLYLDSIAQDLLPGSYELRVFDQNDCRADTLFEIDFISLSDELGESRIDMYPNPTTDFIHIDNFSMHSIRTIKLLGLDGRVLKIFHYSHNNPIRLDMAELNLPGGIYLVKIIRDGKAALLKRVVLLK